MPETETPAPAAEETAEPVAAAGPDPEAPPPPRRSLRPLAIIAALLVVAGLGFALAWVDPWKWRGEDPVPALQAEIAQLSGGLKDSATAQAALAARLDALEVAKPAPAVDPAAVDALASRVAALETTLDKLASAPAADGSVSAATVAALQASVETLKADVAASGGASTEAIRAAVDQAMAAWTAAEAGKTEAARQQLAQAEAVARLREAARSGAPYADALAALGGVEVDPILRQNAETGLPGRAGLAESFPDAARRALDAALRATGGEGISDRLLTFLRVQTGARSLEPREGDDPDAVLSRAEASVKAGDLAAALAGLSALPPEAQAELKDWSDRATLQLAAEKAIADLASRFGQ